MYVKWQVTRTPFVLASKTWDTTQTTTLSRYSSPVVMVSLDEGRDSFKFQVEDFNGKYHSLLQPNDKIVLSRVTNASTFAATDVLMTGALSDSGLDITAASTTLTPTGYNFTDALMSAIAFVDATSLTIPQAINQALVSVQAANNNFGITWNTAVNGNVNTMTMSKGGSFPVVGTKLYNMPIKDILKKYSTNQYTTDGQYYWYVDTSNQLVWLRASQTVTSGLSFNDTTDSYKSLKVGKDVQDVRNFLIMKGGVDPEGTPIQTPVADWVSIAKHGIRFQLIPNAATNAQTLVAADKLLLGVTSIKDASFPLSGSRKPAWASGSITSYNTSSDSTSYIASLRVYIKAQLKAYGLGLLESIRYGRLQLDVAFNPGKGWLLGQLVPCTVSSLGTAPKSLRVINIQYTTTKDSFTLKEDIGSL